MYIPENILSANLSNKLLFPTPKKRTQKKKKRLKTISALIWLHYCTHSTCMTEERSQH